MSDRTVVLPTIKQGADYSLDLKRHWLGDGQPPEYVDMTGFSGILQLRRTPQSYPVVTLTRALGITFQGASGKIDIVLTAIQTAAIPPGDYKFDFKVTSPCREVVEIRCGTPRPTGPPGPARPPGPPGPAGGAKGDSVLQAEGPFVLSAGDFTNGYVTVTSPLVNAINSVVQILDAPVLVPDFGYAWLPGTSRITFSATIRSRLIAGDTVWVRRLIYA